MELFADVRDGQTYKTVKIGDQVWLAENFRFKCGKCCPPDGKQENVEKFGYLYDWQSVYEAVPEGWHLPTRDEMKTFQKFLEDNGYAGIEGITLRSSTSWLDAEKLDAWIGVSTKVIGSGTNWNTSWNGGRILCQLLQRERKYPSRKGCRKSWCR